MHRMNTLSIVPDCPLTVLNTLGYNMDIRRDS